MGQSLESLPNLSPPGHQGSRPSPIVALNRAIAVAQNEGPERGLEEISEDWSPWIALLRMRERWPELSFEMKASYLQMGK